MLGKLLCLREISMLKTYLTPSKFLQEANAALKDRDILKNKLCPQDSHHCKSLHMRTQNRIIKRCESAEILHKLSKIIKCSDKIGRMAVATFNL